MAATVYRGRHPYRVESVGGCNPAHPDVKGWRYLVRLNNGQCYGVAPHGGKLPALGRDLKAQPWEGRSAYLYQSTRRLAVPKDAPTLQERLEALGEECRAEFRT